MIEPPFISAPTAEDLGGFVNEAEQWLDLLAALRDAELIVRRRNVPVDEL